MKPEILNSKLIYSENNLSLLSGDKKLHKLLNSYNFAESMKKIQNNFLGITKGSLRLLKVKDSSFTVLVSTPKGKFVFKAVDSTNHFFPLQVNAVFELSNLGVDQFVCPITNSDGNICVSYKSFYWSAYPFIKRMPKSKENYNPEKITKELIVFEKSISSHPNCDSIRNLRKYEKDSNFLNWQQSESALNNLLQEFSGIRQKIDSIPDSKMIFNNVRTLVSKQKQFRTLIHGDMQLNNIIQNENNAFKFYDYECVNYGWICQDIVNLGVYLVSIGIDPTKTLSMWKETLNYLSDKVEDPLDYLIMLNDLILFKEILLLELMKKKVKGENLQNLFLKSRIIAKCLKGEDI